VYQMGSLLDEEYPAQQLGRSTQLLRTVKNLNNATRQKINLK